MKQPAPPSQDPLLARPAVDFSARFLVAVVRGDNMYAGVDVASVQVEGTRLIVSLNYPPLGDTTMLAAMSGIGTYVAVELPRFEGEVVFRSVPSAE